MGYYGYRKIRHDFEITKREVLFSIAIIAVMTPYWLCDSWKNK